MKPIVEIDIEFENIFLLKEEILCFVSKIFIKYFNEFSKRKKEFRKYQYIDLFNKNNIYFYLISSYYPNINDRLKTILISNDNDNISFY